MTSKTKPLLMQIIWSAFAVFLWIVTLHLLGLGSLFEKGHVIGSLMVLFGSQLISKKLVSDFFGFFSPLPVRSVDQNDDLA